jgi:hypothetical protein
LSDIIGAKLGLGSQLTLRHGTLETLYKTIPHLLTFQFTSFAREMPTPALEVETVLELDGYLKPDIPAILRRHEKFRKWKDTIEQYEGGYDAFTKGYLKFGLNVGKSGEVVYREWAPNAKQAYLIGDFSEFS